MVVNTADLSILPAVARIGPLLFPVGGLATCKDGICRGWLYWNGRLLALVIVSFHVAVNTDIYFVRVDGEFLLDRRRREAGSAFEACGAGKARGRGDEVSDCEHDVEDGCVHIFIVVFGT